MHQIITSKLKLETTAEQFVLLRQTQLAFRDALNVVSRYAFENGKISSAQLLHEGTYRTIRSKFNLPSQMACSVMRQVSTSYKGLWMKLNKNIEHRRSGYTKRRFRGLDKPPKYLSPTLTYVNGRDYGFKRDQHVSLLTLNGRITLRYQGYSRHVALIHQGVNLGEAKLWYDKRHRQYYLLVSLKLEIADPSQDIQQTVIGVDVGQRYLAVTSTMTGENQFYSGKAVRATADHYARLQKRLRRKGTRGATKRLIAISGRERRFKLQTNHIIAKTIVTANQYTLIGMESLTDIREHTRRGKRYRRKGKRTHTSSPKQRRANRHASTWAFAELQDMVRYKAALSGSRAILVDADYTSQTCPHCGYKDKRNRPHGGLMFGCQNQACPYGLRVGHAYTLHADLIGARNIAMRTLLIRQDWVRTGVLPVRPGPVDPNVSDREAKAARLSRYAELRWSLDTSSIYLCRSIWQ
jgi:IS605 OrfB family transposase